MQDGKTPHRASKVHTSWWEQVKVGSGAQTVAPTSSPVLSRFLHTEAAVGVEPAQRVNGTSRMFSKYEFTKML